MAITRYKTFSDGQVLTAADMNGIQDQVINNEQDVGNPRTESFDMDGQRLILSTDGNTSMIASTANKIDFRLSSADLFDLDGTVSSPVNGFTVIMSATGVAVRIQAKGSDTNIGASLASKGTGTVVLRSNALDVLTVTGIASGVNGLGVVASATGNPVIVGAAGGDTNINLLLAPKGSGSIDINGVPLILDVDADSTLRETSDDVIALRLQAFDAFIFDGDAASPVNGITFRSSATTVDPALVAHGSDSLINVRLTPKGAGVVASAGGYAVDGATALTWRWTGSGTSLVLQENTGTPTVPIWTTRTTVPTGSSIAGPLLIATYSPTGANLDITLAGKKCIIQLSVQPATDSVSLLARTKGSLSGGAFDAAASDYGYQYTEVTTTGTVNGVGSTGAAQIELCTSNIGNTTVEFIDLDITVNMTTFAKRITWAGGYLDTGAAHREVQGSGKRLGNFDSLLELRLFWEGGGNFVSGSVAYVWAFV